MILFLLIFSSFPIIPQKYLNLSKSALSKSFLKQNSKYEKQIFYPGKYQHDRISFEVKNIFTTTNNINIKSFALDQKLRAIALVLNNNNNQSIINGSFLLDQETSKIYHLVEMIGNDDKVTLYKFQSTDIFHVLSNIKVIYNSQEQLLDDDDFNNNSYYSIGYPKNCSYEELKQIQTNFIPFTDLNDDENVSFGVKIGGYTKFSTSYEFSFISNEEFYSKINFLGEAKMESGFHITNSTSKIDNLKISATDLHANESEKILLNHYIYEIFGIQLTIDFYLNFNLHVDEIFIDFSPDFYLTSLSSLNFNKEYEYSTSTNEKILTKTNSYNYQLDFDLLNNEDQNNYIDLKIHFKPVIDISVSADIKFVFPGNDPKITTIENGVRNIYDVKIDHIKTENNFCLYPYLSYSYIPYLYHIFYISNNVDMNSVTLIKNRNLISKTYWIGEQIGPKCIYGCYNADSNVSIDLPVLYSDEINNTNSHQLSLDFLVGDNKYDIDIKGDKKLNLLKKINSKNDNLTLYGNCYDSDFSNKLLLTFYPKKFQSNLYLNDQMTTLTDFYFIESNFFFKFYQGIELKLFEEVYPNESNKFAFLESPYNFTLIQHKNDNTPIKYIINKMNISDDQYSTEEKFSYYFKNNWKLKISDISIKITVMLINSSSNITEKSFLYDENVVFNMDNRKLGLLFEFENGENKFILIDYDFSIQRQVEITKELYYNYNIKILLIPHTPFVFFDLDNFLNNTGLIAAPILDCNEIYSFDEKKEIKFLLEKYTESWKYLIFRLKTDFEENLINETLFIVISSTGFYPLNAKEEFYNNIYLLEFDEFIFENGFLVFYIPFIRKSDYKEDDKIVVLSIFAQPLINDAFCPNSFHYSQFNSKISLGCIENNFNFESNFILTAIDQTGNQYNPTQMLFEQDALVYVNLFNQKSDVICLIARIPKTFPENSLTLTIDNLLVDALTSYSFNTIKIKCDRCSGVFRNGETYQLNDEHEIEIKIIKENYNDYYAICSKNEDKFCIQKLSLNPNKVTLINRPLVSNFVSLNFLESLPEILIPKAQLFSTYGKSFLIYSKDSKYGLSIANELNPQIDLKLQADTRGDFFRLYTVTLNNIFFPFSPISILSSFKESLNQLGLNPNDFSFYKIRDEIFINNKNAFLKLPNNPSSDLLYGLSSSVIRSISTNYQISSLNPQSFQKSCFCFVETTSTNCRDSGYTSCTNYLKITPHEYNNVDAYFPSECNWGNLVLHFECDIYNFYPDLSVFPINTWKLFFTSYDNHKVSGALIIPSTERFDSIIKIDCSNLDVTVEASIQDQRYGHLDFSSSNSHISLTVKIKNEINYKINNVISYYNRESIFANAHYLQSWKISKLSNKISTRSEYIYKIIDIYSYHNDDIKGHYKFFIALQEYGVHLNENFCSYDFDSPECLSNSLKIITKQFHTIGDIIDSYPDRINKITIDVFNTNVDVYSDSFYKVSSKHQNVLLIMKSSNNAVIKPTLIIYQNLNISFEGNLDISQLTLQQQVKVGSQRNVSFNNKRVKKVEISAICPDKEIGFDKKQIIIKDFNSANQYSFSGISCNLAHSTLSVSIGVDSDLYLNINQNFNSYPNEYCLFSFSSDKCNSIEAFPVRIVNFNSNFIQSGTQVTITIVDDYEINLNLQSKSIVFKGLNKNLKLFGTLTLSSDSTVVFQNIDISELNLIFSFDISNNRITSFNFNQCETLPNLFECKLINLNSNLLETKFAELSVFENITLKWNPFEIAYENIIITTELVIDNNFAFIKLNHINPNQILCYYALDSSRCPSISTVIQPSNMWQNYNNSLIYISDYLSISNVNIKDQIVYFTGPGQINGKLILSSSTVCHFIDNNLINALTIETQVDFESQKSPKIVFGDHKSNLEKWILAVNGYDFTCSFCIFENKFLLPNEIIKSNVNSNILIERKEHNTEIRFVQLYEPNHFCVYDYPYESICLTEYPEYLPIKSSELWFIKLNSKTQIPKIIFASKSNSMFLPLKRFKDENIQETSIEILPFSMSPIFLVPEGFTLIIKGDSSKLAAKISINTTSLQYGKILFNDISQIQLIATDKTAIYDDNSLLLLNEENYLLISYKIQKNDLYNMSEIVVISIFKNYDYDSESIDDLYNDESTELKTLKLTKETILNYSKLKIKKLGIYGSKYNISLTSEVNSNQPFLNFLFINSSSIVFDSFLNFEVGVFYSNINLYPFAVKQQISPEISLKYLNSFNVYDGSLITIDEEKIKINNEEFSFDQNQFDLYLNDFCLINDSIGKTIDFHGKTSLIYIEKSENSSYSFNEFDVLIINSESDLFNVSFNNISMLHFNSNVEINIDNYIQVLKNGNLSSLEYPINIKKIDLYGKPFYCENAFVESLNIYKNKSLIKGVNLSDSLCIYSSSSLVAHSSSFCSTTSAYFHISTTSPLLVLVNSTFDCDELIINFDYSYQNEEFVLIKGLESLDYCDYIKNKTDESRYKINYDLSCRINEIDELIELVAGNCTVFSKEFTESNEFTESIGFSTSFHFTYSNYFSKTNEFSYTSQFSISDVFSESKNFTYSNQFTVSRLFSSSNEFSYSNVFSKTTEFSISSYFTFSNDFTDSNRFTYSNKFTDSGDFSSSSPFTISNVFSKTTEFSLSSDFTFSNDFTDSKQFTYSNEFTKSNDFTVTNMFSHSNIFSKTIEFSISSQFSESNIFSNSNKFTKTNEFTLSNIFITQTFSGSNCFTDSSYFTQSSTFLISQATLNPFLTYSRSTFMSLSIIRTVIFSYSNSMFVTYIECFNGNELNSFCLTNIYTFRYFPYIIYSYKRTYVVSYLGFLIRRRHGITKEQLIAITCISAAVFFSIIGIIVMALKKKKETYDDYSISSEDDRKIERKDEIQISKSEIIQFKNDNDDNDLNFWL